jgi:signal transduction histidine kinase
MSSDPRLPSDAIGDTQRVQDQLQRLRQEQERLFVQLQEGEQHFKRLARSVWRVQEDERRRLARELHDGIGQNLTALRHRIDALSRMATCTGAAAEEVARALALCDTAIGDVRVLSRLLRPQILDDLGLEAALRWLARTASEGSASAIEVDVAGVPGDLDGDIATLVFRLAQEALNNAIKHAQAQNVVLRLSVRGAHLLLLIVDDGRGCSVEQAFAKSAGGESTGVTSMRERVRLFGGQFQFNAQPGQGVQIRVMLPLGHQEI